MTTFAARTPNNFNFHVVDYLMKTRPCKVHDNKNPLSKRISPRCTQAQLSPAQSELSRLVVQHCQLLVKFKVVENEVRSCQQIICPVDTGQYFKKGRPKAQFFQAYSKVKNPKVGSFLRAPEYLEGLRSQKNLIFQNAQIKVQTINSNLLL